MRQYEAVWVYGGNHLFCGGFAPTNIILGRLNPLFCLINPHMPHTFGFIERLSYENMRIMRIYEDKLFNGFYLTRLNRGLAGGKNMRIDSENMRIIFMFWAKSGLEAIMSEETRQWQEMVRVAYHQLEHKKKECKCVYTPTAAQLCGFRCPECGGELVARDVVGVVCWVHRAETGD